MIFKTGQVECFVYITLPGQTFPVTAGKFTRTPDRTGTAIGRFRYGKSYLGRPNAVPLDPIELKLSDHTYTTVALKGIFGALRDAGPDAWGRRVIERHVGPTELSEIDYLLFSPDDRAGALSFGLVQEPSALPSTINQALALDKFQTIADAIVRNEQLPTNSAAPVIDELVLVGTSMGGARPKTVVEDQEGWWLAKFNRPDDRWNYALVEHAMLTLAKECGITSAHSKVVEVAGRDVLLAARFDRERSASGHYPRSGS